MSEIANFGEFFAPASTDMIDGLVAQYDSAKKKCEGIADIFSGDANSYLRYFFEGNGDKHAQYGFNNRLFELDGAVKALNSAYWSKALAMTDVLDCMPQKRRDEWHKSISDKTAPDFVDATVRATLNELLNQRSKFLAERVDGIFRGLSGEHVTNKSVGFSKRMIVGYVLSSYGSPEYSASGRINDLRAVIAKFMGRGELGYNESYGLIESLKKSWGKWVTIDGGALKIRLYKKGTAHIEVHPDMAWRLNQILAYLYPLAIPAQHRTRPAKKLKEFEMMQKPIGFAVLKMLRDAKPYRDCDQKSVHIRNNENKAASIEVANILRALGGVEIKSGSFQFDYEISPIIDEVCLTGGIPDQRSHQYYPTPENVAQDAVELAEIEAHHDCLEPSAGQGGLADYMPKSTKCCEISKLHCDILTAKGFEVLQGDFLAMASQLGKFDRIVMNPPYSEGRWQAHTIAASKLLKSDGVLVSVLPASAPNSFSIAGFSIEWSRTYANEFTGTSVSVAIAKIKKEKL
ncbi:AdoMet_MTases domain containing protein [uncultured Caudovirales phage]|uniref:AdoMet_MTases domain containing protein n=1 Tax=uncultured Caudovirales phage TaxID=2100421 RepID=A0A6J5LK71_9CAUD|nr:AdoMet_MTases domain containing protein [uncultured Caudovirales phage]